MNVRVRARALPGSDWLVNLSYSGGALAFGLDDVFCGDALGMEVLGESFGVFGGDQGDYASAEAGPGYARTACPGEEGLLYQGFDLGGGDMVEFAAGGVAGI